MAVSDFYTARCPDFICIGLSAHYKYDDELMMMMMMMTLWCSDARCGVKFMCCPLAKRIDKNKVGTLSGAC